MDSWWQTIGGDVGSNTDNVSTDIPKTCLISNGCPSFLTRFLAGVDDSTGVITRWNGTNYFGEGGSASGGDNFVAQAKIPTSRGTEGYDYFYRNFEMGPNPEDDFPIKNGANQPDPISEQPLNGRAYFSDGNLVVNDNSWNVGVSESIVVFVDGNLVIDTRIFVEKDGFLAFIVSGDITFETENPDPTSEVADVAGVYIADGILTISEGNQKFVGEGTFVGWSGVVLGRDYGNEDNNLNPAELFIYRPDFVLNAPDWMKRPVLRWEEVAP